MNAGETIQSLIPEVDPLTFSLPGSHLIEASAGTGKTWTIAALYVRLVLGHGELPALLPGQILVLTFTEAAAQELRDRIRRRLSEAATGFAAGLEVEPAPDLADAYLQALRATYPPDRWAACARLLDLAAQSMDEAAISTIHAWCMRALKEHAFDSAMLFEQEMLTDLGELTRTLAWDYWRSNVAGLDDASLAEVLKIWRDPDALAWAYGAILTQEGLPSKPAMMLSGLCADMLQVRAAALAAIKADWQPRIQALDAWLDVNRSQIGRMNDVDRWMRSLHDWLALTDQPPFDAKSAAWKGLSAEGLAARWKGKDPMPDSPEASQALDQLRQALDSLPTLDQPIREHALGWLADRLHQTLASRSAMGFDGLLTGLAHALKGVRGEPLAQTLRQQFPVVLIDEFQDTDPVQYRIFDRIYQVAQPIAGTALIFIGDPKQAIYGFRGADVQTYLQAAQACQGRVQTLKRNYRSSRALVQAVNHVFDRQTGAPVFPTGQADQEIAFHAVQAQGRDEVWVVDEDPVTAMQAWPIKGADQDAIGVTTLRPLAAQACARQLAHWLRLGRAGRAGFQSPQGFRPVVAADMAILVNKRDEAGLVREALSALGIRSVYLSDNRSVFESAVAQDLGFILAACAHPGDEQTIRAALATPLLGLSTAQLAKLVDNEWAWDDQVEGFQRYRQRWQWRGVLPMLRQLLHDFSVPARLLAQGAEGERQLTDCLHLAELLQQASAQLDGEEALLHYLALQRDAQLAQADAEGSRRVRLESDEALVRVVTVHKSKGLEYPLVFLPFVSCGLWEKPGAGPHALHVDGQRQWLLQLNAAQHAQLQAERLGEETRKFYVALTRARHAVWLALADTGRPSGVAHVLGGNIFAAWEERCQTHPAQFAWGEDIQADVQPSADDLATEAALGPARRLSSVLFSQHWEIASYSGLQLADAPPRPAVRMPPDTAAEDVLLEESLSLDAGWGTGSDDRLVTCLADFPRGSQAGTFLHGLLEWAAQRQFRHLDGARDMIARRCAVRGWETQIDGLHQWLLGVVSVEWRPLLPGAPGLRLDRLPVSLAEMEFWLPTDQVSVAELDRLITAHTFDGAARPALAADHLNGLFKGFIDLTVQLDDGRYYVLDYKSNHLGQHWRDYDPSALQKAMCAARYDVQMMLYVLALHRQLRARLPDYDYTRHLGGAIYLFLRGQETPGQGLVSLCPSQVLIESLDTLFAGGLGLS
ncbi:exodeoxyribonuclease V subunit beta [Castellaniella sp.]|uniref:exodeoxyribonuclease V subunit beta n=1 Tax=Castellaniella sp. TaxID=1955812 RepID=UPI002AFDE7BE|nr:exodeoxyribonuclease V subunit beta [Castellaniella sp.]